MAGVGWSSEPQSAPLKPHHQCHRRTWVCPQTQLLREQVCQLRAPGKSHTSLLLTICHFFFFFFLQKRWQKTYDCVKLYLALKGLNHIVNCDPNADWRCGIHSMSVIWGQFKGKKTETMAYKKQHEALGCVLLGRTPFLFPYPRPPPRSILSLLGTLHQGWGWVWKGEGSREEEQGPQTWCLKKEGKYFICKSLFQLLTNTLTKLWGKK